MLNTKRRSCEGPRGRCCMLHELCTVVHDPSTAKEGSCAPYLQPERKGRSCKPSQWFNKSSKYVHQLLPAEESENHREGSQNLWGYYPS